jgi:hypothetical protein
MSGTTEYIVSNSYLSSMKNKRNELFNIYKHYEDLLQFREKCNDKAICTKSGISWDTTVSDYVKKLGNVDESVDGKTMTQLKDKIMSDIEKLWNISAYLGMKKGDVVNITIAQRASSPQRGSAFKLIKFMLPVSTKDSVNDVDPFKILVETVAPAPNKLLNIVKEYAIPVIAAALSSYVAYTILKNDSELHGGGKEEEEVDDLLKQLKSANISKSDISDYVKNLTDEEKKIIKEKVQERTERTGRKVSTEDFAEFGLNDNDTVFGFMDTGSRGGKRKRNTKRGTKKNKKNKKSNRKRRA